MGWKDLSYWLRGGIILFVLYLFSFIISLFDPYVIVLTTFPGIIILHGVDYNITIFAVALGFIIMSILSILVGSLLGFIYGKIKNRKK